MPIHPRATESAEIRRAQVGILKVHLFRPVSTEHFLAELPESVHREGTLEGGCGGWWWMSPAAVGREVCAVVLLKESRE